MNKRLRDVIELRVGFIPEKKMEEEYREKEKSLYMCCVDLEKAFDRISRKVVKSAMRKKGIPETTVKAVTSLYDQSWIRLFRQVSR